ncbi:MAG TPA: RNA methyltransferase [Pirellulales bacterium]|jgi:TrmH family RNA methyltransferase|nr:RNA methyltransferase [Pirellulales bacterium]
MTDRLITSVHNPRIKEAAKLRERRHRKRTGHCLIDGARELLRALDAGVPIVEAFVCRDMIDSGEQQTAVERLEASIATVWETAINVFAKLAFGDRTEGVIAVVETPQRTLDSLQLSKTPLVAVLEGVEKPGNLGAVLRSADAAGVSALIAADPATDLYNPNTIRASMGTIFTVPTVAASAEETLAWLRTHQLAIVAARTDAQRLYHEIDLSHPTAIVLGSEARGLSDLWTAGDITPARLPMLGVADSLNVSVSAAVMFYEALRQRSI